MAEPLTILADAADGRHFEVTLDKGEEADTALLRLEVWHSNLDHRRDEASKDDVLRLYDIRFDQTRRLVCKAKMNGSYPAITFMLNPATEDAKPYIRTVVQNSFAYLTDGTRDFPLEPKDYDALKQYLLAQNYPQIEASVIRNEKAVLRR